MGRQKTNNNQLNTEEEQSQNLTLPNLETYFLFLFISAFQPPMMERIFFCVCVNSRRSYRLSWWLCGKESVFHAGDPVLIPGSERSSGEGHATHSIFLSCRTSLNQSTPFFFSISDCGIDLNFCWMVCIVNESRSFFHFWDFF